MAWAMAETRDSIQTAPAASGALAFGDTALLSDGSLAVLWDLDAGVDALIGLQLDAFGNLAVYQGAPQVIVSSREDVHGVVAHHDELSSEIRARLAALRS